MENQNVYEHEDCHSLTDIRKSQKRKIDDSVGVAGPSGLCRINYPAVLDGDTSSTDDSIIVLNNPKKKKISAARRLRITQKKNRKRKVEPRDTPSFKKGSRRGRKKISAAKRLKKNKRPKKNI